MLFQVDHQSKRLGQHGMPSVKIQRYGYLIAFVFLYLYATISYASEWRLWYDEIVTSHVSHLPNLSSICQALSDGIDGNPPLLYLVTRMSFTLLGDGNVGLRFPAIIGFLVMCLSLYLFVLRRCPEPYAIIAMLFPLITGAYLYASEARSYGLVLGACGLSLTFWQSATKDQRHIYSLVGLSVSLSIALCSHGYAILVFIPLVVGELVRTLVFRRVDWNVWISFFIPLPILFTYIPLFRVLKSFAWDNLLFRPNIESIAESYMLKPAIFPLLASFIILEVYSLSAKNHNNSTQEFASNNGLKSHELAAGICLVLLPLVTAAIAYLTIGVFVSRYAIPSVLGLSILFANLASDCARGNSRCGLAIALVLLLSFGVQYKYFIPRANSSDFVQRMTHLIINQNDRVTADNSHLPIVVSNGLLFLEMAHYMPPPLTSRLHYLISNEDALRYTKANMCDRGLSVLARWVPLSAKVEEYHSFVSRNPRFLVFSVSMHPLEWLVSKLLDAGARLKLQNFSGNLVIYEVDMFPNY